MPINVHLKAKIIMSPKSQKQIARETGLYEAKISMIVQGKTEPGVYEAQKIARALDATVGELWPLDEKP